MKKLIYLKSSGMFRRTLKKVSHASIASSKSLYAQKKLWQHCGHNLKSLVLLSGKPLCILSMKKSVNLMSGLLILQRRAEHRGRRVLNVKSVPASHLV